MREFGLVGAKLAHSHSPRIHRALGDYGYELIEADRGGLGRLLRERAFKGLNVTIPYKVDAMDYCDELTSEARLIGSVNTIVKDDQGRLIGHNTDLYGFEMMAQRAGVSMKARKVLILGSGGSSRMAAVAARRAGASDIIVVSRGGPVDYGIARRLHSDADVIINTTPVGMYPNNGAAPIDLNDYANCKGVLDLIYNPLNTALLLQARDMGIPCADGLTMLVAQALRASELFMDTIIDEGRIIRIDNEMRGELSNITMIGMPGSGKSTIGCALAEYFNLPFVDIDAEIVSRSGRSIPEIFHGDGETAFRAIEREVCADVGKRGGQIIAAGGGAPLDQRNVDAFRQNGFILWVRRPIQQLEQSGRPLSQGMQALAEMEQKRLPVYQSISDAVIDNNNQLSDAVAQAIAACREWLNVME